SFNYDAVDREQINRATIGTGTIIVDGKETNPNINRDESKAQEITKDVSVDKVGIEYSDNRKEWSLSSLQDIFGEQLKEAVIVPMDTLNKKLKLDEKNDFFVSDIAVYKLVVEKDLEGNIKENYIQVPNDTIFEKGSVAHTNGMNTDEEIAKDETIKLHLKKDINDNKLHYLENGEKKEFYVLQNRTHGNNSDLYESAIDKFGIKGDKKVYSEAAKELGEIIWRNRENIEEKSLFSQGNIQYYAALHYIEEKYGIKYDIWAAHSHYSKGSEPNSYIDYSTWQKPLIYSDKFLKMLNIQNYFKNKEKIEINKGADRNENIK
ncbi:hypothetical protein, partial [Fusobacterium sp.]|uniref:hypothetical protein n=1 Tax=Fusobacterium sp. TaxID=68766 RepID=UPI0025BA9A50